MKKCKYCKQSNFGAELTETIKVAVLLVDGKEVERDDSELVVLDRQYVERVCMICQKEITANDLYELETCPSCNRQVETLIDGLCEKCHAKANALFEANKMKIYLSILKGSKETEPKNEEKSAKVDKPAKADKEKKEKKSTGKIKQEVIKIEEPQFEDEEDNDLGVAASNDVDLSNAIDDIDTDGLDIYSDEDGELF